MIPKIIHQIVGSSPPKMVESCLFSWGVLKKEGFKIRIWNDELINDFVRKYYPFALEAILNARNHGEASDIARYLIIYHFGGYYMDWDIELVNPKTFLKVCSNYKTGFLVIDPLDASLASECFSAISEECYLLSLVRDITEIYTSGNREFFSTPEFSGPIRMRYSLKKHLNASQRMISTKEIFAYSYSECRTNFGIVTGNQPLIHYWIHSWVTF